LPNTLIQPFHHIRVVVGTTENNPVYAMSLIHNEMREQKRTLCQMLQAGE
jgi:hypothetical protein